MSLGPGNISSTLLLQRANGFRRTSFTSAMTNWLGAFALCSAMPADLCVMNISTSSTSVLQQLQIATDFHRLEIR